MTQIEIIKRAIEYSVMSEEYHEDGTVDEHGWLGRGAADTVLAWVEELEAKELGEIVADKEASVKKCLEYHEKMKSLDDMRAAINLIEAGVHGW